MPSCAPRPQATTSAAGVASPSAHGQAMISTASAALTAALGRAPGGQPPGQRQRRRGQHQRDEHAADPVGEPLDRATSPPAPARPGRSGAPAGCPRRSSRRGRSAGRSTTTVPAVTAPPSVTSAGTDSPVITLVSTADSPNSTTPSAAIASPGRTTTRSPGPQLPGRDPPLGPVPVQHAGLPRPGGGQLAHRVPGIAPRPGLDTTARPARTWSPTRRPPGRSRRRRRAAATASALTPACPRSRTNIAYTDQPHAAAMPSDTSVSIDAAPCRAFFSAAGVERPRRPPRDRRGQRRPGPTASPGTSTTGTATAAPTGH